MTDMDVDKEVVERHFKDCISHGDLKRIRELSICYILSFTRNPDINIELFYKVKWLNIQTIHYRIV